MGRAEGPGNQGLQASVLLLTTGPKTGMRFSRAIKEQVLRTVKGDFKEVKIDEELEMENTEARLAPAGISEAENCLWLCFVCQGRISQPLEARFYTPVSALWGTVVIDMTIGWPCDVKFLRKVDVKML